MTTSQNSSIQFDTLVQHQSWVRELARRLVGDDAGADDVVQETFIAAWRNPPRTDVSPRGWLATVVRNFVRQRQRAQTRRAHWESRMISATTVPSTADTLARAEAHQRVVRAVMELDEPSRSTVLLRFFDGLPPREVARRMEVPVETVRTRTRRALARLREHLDEDYSDRRAWRLALLPLALPDSPGIPAGGGGTAGTVGVMLMSATAKKVTVAAVLILLGAAAWTGLRGPTSDAADPDRETASVHPVDPAEKAGSRRRGSVPDPGSPEALPTAVAPAPVPAGPPVKVRVIREDGGPVAGATVLFFSGEDALGTGTVNGAGVAEIPAPQRDANVVVVLPGSPPQRIPGRWTQGSPEHTVTVPAGRRVSGIVRIDGAVPTSPVRVTLRWELDLDARDLLPDAGWRALHDAGSALESYQATDESGVWMHLRPVEVATSTDGRFEFVGLPETDSAILALPRGLLLTRWEMRESEVRVRVPSDDLVIEARSLPRLRGRVLYADGGGPATTSRLDVEWTGADGHRGNETYFLDDPEGRFDVPLFAFEVSRFAVVATDGGGRGRRTWEFSGGDRAVWELGDLELGPTRTVTVLPRTPDGKVVPGTIVTDESADEVLGRDEDRDGAVRIRLATDATRIRVGARGWRVAVVEIPVGAGNEITVELTPESWLSCSIQNLGDDPVAGLKLVVRSAAPMFTGPDDEVDPLLIRAGSAQWMYDLGDETERVLTYPLDEHGSLDLGGLRTDGPNGRIVRLQFTDALGIRHEDMTVLVEPGRRATASLRTRFEPRRLFGLVVDGNGEPVGGARVHVAAGLESREFAGEQGLGSISRRTEADGTFAFAGLMVGTVDLRVEKRGLAPVTVRGVSLAEGAETPVFELLHGKSVDVTVVDDDGEPVVHAQVHVFLPSLLSTDGAPSADGLRSATHLGKGVYRLVDLPDATMRIHVQIDNKAFPFDHATSTPSVRRVLPPGK